MPISAVPTDITIDFSDRRRMFRSFCAYAFMQRNLALENETSMGITIEDNEKNDLEKADTTATTAELPSITVWNFKTMHKCMSSIIKTAMDSENVASFHKNVRDTIYAMASMADEIFLNMEWNGKSYWEKNILEFRFFGTQTAGETIFLRINELLAANNPLSVEMAEIYLKMLALGFKGKCRGLEDEDTQIAIYRNELFDFILRNDKSSIEAARYRSFQKEYTHTIPTIARKLLPDGAIITYVSSFFVFMFLVLSSTAWLLETRHIKRLLFEISYIALQK
jgi:type IV/VI secretion system ImpK/VasF family protein